MKSFITVAICAMVLVSGCTMFNSPSKYQIDQRTISIDSEPSGANVYLVNPITDKETLLGTTPLTRQPVPVITGVKGEGRLDRCRQGLYGNQPGQGNNNEARVQSLSRQS